MRLSIIETDPDERQQTTRVADEPRVTAIVARSGLPGELTEHAAHPGVASGPALDDVLEESRHEMRTLAGQHALSLRSRSLSHAFANGNGFNNPTRGRAPAAVRERQICPGKFHRGYLESAQSQ